MAKHSVPPKLRAVERFSLKGESVKGGSTVTASHFSNFQTIQVKFVHMCTLTFP